MINPKFKNISIRLLYIFPLIIFIILLVKSTSSDLNSNSSFGIKYLYVLIVPIFIFSYQSIRNSIIGWIFVMLLYISYLGLWIYGLIEAFEDIGVKTQFIQYFLWWIPVIIFFGLGFLYFKFRPKSRII
jgi:hypothetical protein